MNKIIFFILSFSILILVSCNSKENETPDSTLEMASPASSINQTEKTTPQAKETAAIVNRFEVILNEVNQISYELKGYEVVDKEQNFLTRRIKEVNPYKARQQKKLIPQIDISNLIKVRKAFIKGTKAIKGNLYPRADIESWEMSNEKEAIEIYKAIEKIKNSNNWETISKSPITCFQKGKEIIFITPGGFYMLDKVAIIQKYLQEKL